MIRGIKCAGRKIVYVLVAVLFLASCGKKEQPKDGLVPMETAKGYEHTAKLETEPVVDEPPTPTPEDTSMPPSAGDSTPIPTPGEPEVEDIVYVAVSVLNLRTEPSLESEVVVQAKYGDSFVRLEKGTEGWDKLLYNDQEVYAFAQYLSDKKIAGANDSLSSAVVADAKKK